MNDRTVRRVLVMLDYGDSDPDSGEVFDLTSLLVEMLAKSPYSASLGLSLRAEKTYDRDPEAPKHRTRLSWGGDAGNWVHGASHLEDVINSAMPDGERVTGLRKKAKRLRKKADDVDRDAMVAKLVQVSEIRHQFPIARVTESLPLLSSAK